MKMIFDKKEISETKDYMQELDYFQGLFSQLGNRDVELRKILKRKCLGPITLEDF
jgi:hypothetical protein